MARQTDAAWQKLFEFKSFDLSKDLHFVTAQEINQITGVEARIMAKFDHSHQLPPVFQKNGYFLLPVKNGEYAILRGNGFHLLEKDTTNIETFDSKLKFRIETAGRGSSEMQYLDYAFYCGALEDLLGTGPLYQSIRGREYSKAFSFNVGKTKLQVNSVQIEVDSGLEGKNDLILVEAKMKTPEDFMIRQLFYPYKNYLSFQLKKTIRPVFFTYDIKNEIYNFWSYEFTDENDYNSIRLVTKKSIKINTVGAVNFDEISTSLNEKQTVPPQADDFEKVVELVFKVDEGFDNSQKIANYFDFSERQSSYYRQAAESLDLIYSLNGIYQLTDEGKHFVQLPALDRSIFISNQLRKFSLIKEALDVLYAKKKLTREDLIKIIERNSTLSGSTVPRRAKTLLSWLKWIAVHTRAFEVNKDVFTIVR